MDRYYVQRTGDGYVVRELQKPGDLPGPNDLLIRPFGKHGQEDAHTYAQSANRVQAQLDRMHGPWVKHAMLPAAESQAGDSQE